MGSIKSTVNEITRESVLCIEASLESVAEEVIETSNFGI